MHPSREQLTAFAGDELTRNERAAVQSHMAECSSCRDFLALITPEEGPPPPAVVTTAKKRRNPLARLLGLG